jgi:hypothetical protein
LIIGDLFFDSKGKKSFSISFVFVYIVFDGILHHFHARTDPLVPPKKWIAPLWITVYSVQVKNIII